jgi:hypothetical protein
MSIGCEHWRLSGEGHRREHGVRLIFQLLVSIGYHDGAGLKLLGNIVVTSRRERQ